MHRNMCDYYFFICLTYVFKRIFLFMISLNNALKAIVSKTLFSKYLFHYSIVIYNLFYYDTSDLVIPVTYDRTSHISNAALHFF